MAGKSDKGPWEMFLVEIRGCDGRICQAQVSDPKSVPSIGDFFILPVYVNAQGKLREAKRLMEKF